MRCTKVQELFSGYLEGTIEPSVKVAVEQHFADCSQCKASYERFRASSMLLDELPEMEPPPGFHAAVMARVEQARRTTPHPVRWWRIDWQSVFNARVPVRAVAMGTALLIALAILVSLSPVGPIISTFLPWARPDKCVTPMDNGTLPPGPLPWRQSNETQVRLQGDGLAIGLTANAESEDQVVYMLSFSTDSDESVPVEAYYLPKDVTSATATSGTDKIVAGCVSEDSGNAALTVVSSSAKPAVVQVKWIHNGENRSQFIFLPSRFESVSGSDANAVSIPAGTWRNSLSLISAKYGVVIAAPGSIKRQSKAATIETASPESALRQAILGHRMSVRAVGSSVYMIESIR